MFGAKQTTVPPEAGLAGNAGNAGIATAVTKLRNDFFFDPPKHSLSGINKPVAIPAKGANPAKWNFLVFVLRQYRQGQTRQKWNF